MFDIQHTPKVDGESWLFDRRGSEGVQYQKGAIRFWCKDGIAPDGAPLVRKELRYIPLWNLKNTRRLRIHACIFFFYLALACDTPILESVFWTWNAGDPLWFDPLERFPTEFRRVGDTIVTC
jgi:hypothetical protein